MVVELIPAGADDADDDAAKLDRSLVVTVFWDTVWSKAGRLAVPSLNVFDTNKRDFENVTETYVFLLYNTRITAVTLRQCGCIGHVMRRQDTNR